MVGCFTTFVFHNRIQLIIFPVGRMINFDTLVLYITSQIQLGRLMASRVFAAFFFNNFISLCLDQNKMLTRFNVVHY